MNLSVQLRDYFKKIIIKTILNCWETLPECYGLLQCHIRDGWMEEIGRWTLFDKENALMTRDDLYCAGEMFFRVEQIDSTRC